MDGNRPTHWNAQPYSSHDHGESGPVQRFLTLPPRFQPDEARNRLRNAVSRGRTDGLTATTPLSYCKVRRWNHHPDTTRLTPFFSEPLVSVEGDTFTWKGRSLPVIAPSRRQRSRAMLKPPSREPSKNSD